MTVNLNSGQATAAAASSGGGNKLAALLAHGKSAFFQTIRHWRV
jgi:hypothetical protein